jgi:chromosome segregation ATPase
MKRSRDEETLEQEIEGIKEEIKSLKAEKAKWEGKAEEAQKNGYKDEAKEHWKRSDLANEQLSSVQQQLAILLERLNRKEAREQKREKVDEGGKEVCFLKYV